MKTQLRIILTLAMVLFAHILYAQDKVISGTVTDESGLPLPGATVIIKGTSKGTSTDFDGKYSIGAPQGAILEFSYVGYNNKDVTVGASNVIDVSLEPGNVLEEVVVAAFGLTREKRSMGTATQSIKAEDLQRAGSPNVINSLSGKVAGVQINQAGGQLGSSSRIVIRGNSSFGDNQPLIVIDGVPVSNNSNRQNAVDYGSGLNDINPQDIEDISVLKGGAAAALYGMRAGHGVILITTKKGSARNQGITIDYDGGFNMDQVYGIQKFQNKYGQGYLGSEYEHNKYAPGMSYQDFATGGYNDGMGFSYLNGMGGGVNDGVDESWGPRLDIGLMIPQYNSPIVNGVPQATPWISHPNNIKSFFDLGYTINQNISLTSVSEKSQTRFSIGQRDQKGTLPNTDLKRYNASVNTVMHFNEKLEFNLSTNYIHTRSENLPVLGYNASNPLQSFGQWFGRQVDVVDLRKNWKTTMANGMPYNWNSNYHNNPYWSMNKNTNSSVKDRVFGKAAMIFKPTKEINIETRVGLDYFNAKQNPVQYSGSNETLKDAKTASFYGGWFRLNNQTQMELNVDLIATYNKNFGKVSFDALAGANYRNLKWESSTIGANRLTVPNLFTISNVQGSAFNAMDHSWIRSNSIFGSASLGYDNWIFVNGTIRNDWSSTIHESFSYPSVDVSILPLDLLDAKSSAFSFLKLRGGWAKVGSATSAYRTDPYFSASDNTIDGVTQYSQTTTFPPSGLKPEQVVTSEFGVEARFLNNRIGLDFAVYDKTTTDQIMTVAISKATGYNNMLLNAGEINNKGMELQFNAGIIRNEDGFNWDLILNWAKDKSKIVELYTDPNTGQSLESFPIGSEWGVNVQARPGQPWGVIYGTGMVRDDNGAVIVNANGFPQLQGNMKLGDVNPDWIGGIRNEFSYKNLSLGFLIDVRKGGDIFSVSQMFGAYAGQLGFTADNNVRETGVVLGQNYLTDQTFVKADGSANDITVSAQEFFESYYSNQELSVYDGSYGKLREAHITYNLPSRMLGGNLFKSASISFVGTNLAILWTHKSNKSGVDPENSTQAGNGGVGLESTSIPPSRSMGIKLNLKF